MPRSLRRHALLPLLTALAVAQQDDDVDAWAKLLLTRQNDAITQLAARGAHCLPLLRELCHYGREIVWRGVARTCERLGPTAAPMVPELVAGLVAGGEWWTHLYAAQALIAIGSDEEAVLDALLQAAIDTPVPKLRSVCGRGFGALAADPTERLLAAHDDGRLRDPERATELLTMLGDREVQRQIAIYGATSGDAPTRELLAAALARRGWTIVRQLERAGLADLAQRALRVGPLQHEAFADLFELRHDGPVPAVAHLPRIAWENAVGKGLPFALQRAEERPEGFAVARILLRRDARGAPSLQLDRAVVPRALAADAVRQLELFATARLERVADFDDRRWTSSEHYDRVLVVRDGAPLLDEAFDGYPSAANLPQRFRAQATRVVLDELLHDARWTARDAEDADREQLDLALARGGDGADVVACLREIAALLPPRRD
ncbi:MAG: hypothetical protein H6835_06590 [Planctomycetes bacterium]|nr:hypothetical protein [Planctomycetota bacterium]